MVVLLSLIVWSWYYMQFSVSCWNKDATILHGCIYLCLVWTLVPVVVTSHKWMWKLGFLCMEINWGPIHAAFVCTEKKCFWRFFIHWRSRFSANPYKKPCSSRYLHILILCLICLYFHKDLMTCNSSLCEQFPWNLQELYWQSGLMQYMK